MFITGSLSGWWEEEHPLFSSSSSSCARTPSRRPHTRGICRRVRMKPFFFLPLNWLLMMVLCWFAKLSAPTIRASQLPLRSSRWSDLHRSGQRATRRFFRLIGPLVFWPDEGTLIPQPRPLQQFYFRAKAFDHKKRSRVEDFWRAALFCVPFWRNLRSIFQSDSSLLTLILFRKAPHGSTLILCSRIWGGKIGWKSWSLFSSPAC